MFDGVFLRIGALLRRNYAKLRKIRTEYAMTPPPPELRIFAYSLRNYTVICLILVVEGMLRSFTHITQCYAYILKILIKKIITQCSRRRRINGDAGAAATAAAAN